MNAAARAEHTKCHFFIVFLLSMLPGLGVMEPADVDASKFGKTTGETNRPGISIVKIFCECILEFLNLLVQRRSLCQLNVIAL